MGRCRNKKIWIYFDRLSDYAARCKHCKLQLSCKHTSANLVRHLYYKHHVDASYYGAERTGFLKHKRVRINRDASELKSLQRPEIAFDPLVIKHEIDAVDVEAVVLQQSNCEADRQLQEDETESAQSLCDFSSRPQDEKSAVQHDRGDISASEWCPPNAPIHVESTLQMEKLKAETRYFNEMAELARAKRVMIELQSEKLRLEMETMRTS